MSSVQDEWVTQQFITSGQLRHDRKNTREITSNLGKDYNNKNMKLATLWGVLSRHSGSQFNCDYHILAKVVEGHHNRWSTFEGGGVEGRGEA